MKIDGVEVELTVAPVRGLTLGANFGYNSPKSSRDDFFLAPKTTFAFNLAYDAPEFSNGSYISVLIDGDYRGEFRART
ncbi:hypothetical protein AB5I41_14935 [Sphingomonas sp. MMS24-JH45]